MVGKASILERTIEGRVVEWARKRGWKVKKMNGLGDRGWPDRLFVGPGGICAFIEFKKPGGKLTPLQQDTINELRSLKQNVVWADAPEDAIEYLADLEARALPKVRRSLDG